MVKNKSVSRKVFVTFNVAFLVLLSLLCLLPFINVLALSFSSKAAAGTGQVSLWPVGFNVMAYKYVLQKPEFFKAFGVGVKRVLLGTSLNMLILILTAYPLSKENKQLRMRPVYVWYFVFNMLFSGGLIPTYITVRGAGLLNSIWALVIPGAVQIFSVLILLNFFRGLPKELEESAFMDGANHWTILWRIFVPLSKASLATVMLFSIVNHWNAWFDGVIYINSKAKYPLQTYMRMVVVMNEMNIDDAESLQLLETISDRTVKSAQIFIGSLPILLVYPFLQRYFMTGLVLGSVKG